jgi:hypothetical protein
MSIIQSIENAISEVDQKLEPIIADLIPLVSAFSPSVGVAFKGIDLAIGLINFMASQAENLTNQSNLTALATALQKNPQEATDFLNKIIYGKSNISTVASDDIKQVENIVNQSGLSTSFVLHPSAEQQQPPQQQAVTDSTGGGN